MIKLPPKLPPTLSKLGKIEAFWQEIEPGHALILTRNGSPESRHLAHFLLRSDLEACGFVVYQDEIPDASMQKTATWQDVMNKAVRLYRNGNVNLLRNGYNVVAAQVTGDHGTYMVEFNRDDPSSRAITNSSCTCAYNQYRWDRALQWKKYEGRPCSHLLAAYYQSSATPLDEDIHPATTFGQMPQGQIPGTEPTPQEQGTATYPQQYAPSSDFFQLNQNNPYAQSQLPSQSPPFISPQPTLIPMQAQDFNEQAQEWNQLWKDYTQNAPISIVKQQGPYPGNPTSQTGTLSHIIHAMGETQFNPGDTVRLNISTYAQKEGKPGAVDAGEWVEIPRNTQGQVVDSAGGYVSVIFPMSGFPPMAGPKMDVPYPTMAAIARAYVDAAALSLIPRPGLSSPFKPAL